MRMNLTGGALVARELSAYAVLAACGVGLLYVFISIAATGGYLAVENNTGILYIEVASSAGILLLGVERLISCLRRK